NKKVMNITALAMCPIPLLWTVSNSVWYLMVVQAFSGFVCAGFLLSTGNFIFDAVRPVNRARCTAYLWLFIAVFTVLGSIMGGQIQEFFASPVGMTLRIVPG